MSAQSKPTKSSLAFNHPSPRFSFTLQLPALIDNMQIRKLPDLLAVIAASIAHLVSGITTINIGRVHTRLFSETDMELPMITRAVVSYTATSAPVIVGVALGLATLLGLGLVLRSEKTRWIFPFLLALSFVTVIFHLIFVSFGMSLPLTRIADTMGQ
ncbi:hypothetical protein V2O64_10605 [Verrucomicrobiaceae bacterium 227]